MNKASKNLIPFSERSKQEAREYGRKGGIKSGEKRRKLKEWRELAKEVLALPIKNGKVEERIQSIADAKGKNVDVQTAIIMRQAISAVRGDSKATELLLSLTEQLDEKGDAERTIYPDITEHIIPYFDSLSGDIRRHLHTHYWLKGGRGSTKSSYVSIEILNLLVRHSDVHTVVLRKVANTLKNSVYQQIEWAADKLGIAEDFTFKKSPLEIIYKPTGQTITFLGVDDKGKVKSFKPKFGYVGIVWYEELDQFEGMEEIRNLNQSLLRGGSDYWCFYTFNPPKSHDNWVNIEQLVDESDRLVVHSDYRKVPTEWLGEQFILEAEKLKEKNEETYNHEYLGAVIGTGGVVFENVSDMTMTDEMIKGFTYVYNGLDFGFAIDPLAFTRVYYDSKHEDLYIFDEIYKQKLKNSTASKMILEKIGSEIVTADCAEPKSIAEMQDLGVRVEASRKGADSVRNGIKWLQDLRNIYIDKKRCPHTYKEFATYEYERNKDGQFISAYPDKNNHSIDSVRYGCGRIIAGSRFGW